MISITRQPGATHLSQNQILFEVKGMDADGMQFYWRGVRAELRSVGANGLSSGQFVSVNWTEPEGLSLAVNFSVPASPALATGNPNRLPPYASGTYLAYWESVAAKMAAHPELRPWFSFYATDNGDGTYSVWCTARQYETGWTVAFGPDGAPAFTTSQVAELTTNTPEGYRLRLDVFLEDGYDLGTYMRVATVGSPVNSDSKALFSIEQVLDKSLRNTLPELLVPAWDTAAPYVSPTLLRYYVRAYEQTDNGDPDYTNFRLSTTKRVLCGGIAQSLDAQLDFLGTRDEDSNWLTWRPDGQTVAPEQPYFLAWYCYDNTILPIALEVEEYLADGSVTQTYLYQDDIGQPSQYRVYVFPVGPEALGVSASTVRYRVRVVQEGEIGPDFEPIYSTVSPWRIFYVDRAHYTEVRYLAYLNSFCCPEVVRCVGDIDKDVKIDVEESQAIVPIGFVETFPERRPARIDWEDLFTYRTGYIPRLEADTLQHELRSSWRLYEISPTGYIPLLTRGKSFPITSSRQNLHSVEIEATPALLDRNYSRIDGQLVIPPIEVWGSPDGLHIWTSPVAVPWS